MHIPTTAASKALQFFAYLIALPNDLFVPFQQQLQTTTPPTNELQRHKFIIDVDGRHNAQQQQECGISTYIPPYLLSSNSEELKIVNGHTLTDASALPWMASLHDHQTPPPPPSARRPVANTTCICTATIVAARWVLTAAHCTLDPYDSPGPNKPVFYDNYTIVVGSTDYSSPKALRVKSRRVVPHPGFVFAMSGRSLDDDVALIQLERALPFSEVIQPICLGAPPATIVDVIIAGWGDTSMSIPSVETDTLHDGRMTIVNVSECKTVRASAWDQNICVNGSTFAYFGDSGGPLLVRNATKWTQIGVTQGGSPRTMTPEVYKKVAHFCAWIAAASEGEVNCV